MLLKKITSSPPSESQPHILRAWFSFSPSPAVAWAINSLPPLQGECKEGNSREGEEGAKGARDGWAGAGGLCDLPCREGNSRTKPLAFVRCPQPELGTLLSPPAGFLVSPVSPLPSPESKSWVGIAGLTRGSPRGLWVGCKPQITPHTH